MGRGKEAQAGEARATAAGSPTPVRDHLVDALYADLVGPFAGADAHATSGELLRNPSDWYLTGFLVPEGDREPPPDELEGPGEGERAEAWEDDEVVARFGRLYRMSMAAYELLDDEDKAARVALWRARLWDLSWMMRSLNEWFARKANKEDECRGRFWEGRFKSQPLLDEAALLTCMSYVDLNPVRAGVCNKLDDAEFTSIHARLSEASRRMDLPESAAPEDSCTAPRGLAPFVDQTDADDDPSALPMLFSDYLQLLEWTGRAVRSGAGWLRGPQPAVMDRIGIEPEAWLRTMSSHGIQSLSALGSAERLEALAKSRDKKWVRGQRWARKMYTQAA